MQKNYKPRFRKQDSKRGSDSFEPGDSSVEEKPKAKAASVEKGFRETWSKLFTTPIHLDSALSKLPTSVKSILAQILPTILLRPASQAEVMGIGVPIGEPWLLDPKKIQTWRPAELMAKTDL